MKLILEVSGGETGKMVAPLATVASWGEWNPKLGKFRAEGAWEPSPWAKSGAFLTSFQVTRMLLIWSTLGTPLAWTDCLMYHIMHPYSFWPTCEPHREVWCGWWEVSFAGWFGVRSNSLPGTVLMLAAAWQLHFPSATTVSGMYLAGFKLGSSRRICEVLIEPFSLEIWISSRLSSMAQLTKDSSPVITGVFKFSYVPAALPGNRLKKKIQGWFILLWSSYFEKIISKSQLASSVPQIKYSSLFTVCCSVSSCFLLAILKLSNSLAFQDAPSWPQSSNEFLWFPPSTQLPGRPPAFGEPWAALFSRGSSKCPPVPSVLSLTHLNEGSPRILGPSVIFSNGFLMGILKLWWRGQWEVSNWIQNTSHSLNAIVSGFL